MNTMNLAEMGEKLYDPKIRQRLLAAKPDLSAANELGYRIPEGADVKVVPSKNDVMYVVIPSNKLDLGSISAGGAVGVGTAGSISTLTTTLGSASTMGSAIVT